MKIKFTLDVDDAELSQAVHALLESMIGMDPPPPTTSAPATAPAMAPPPPDMPNIAMMVRSDRFLQVGPDDHAYFVVGDAAWGRRDLTEGPGADQYKQFVGARFSKDPAAVARFAWDWPLGVPGQEVKAFPAIAYGRKPGFYNTSAKPGGIPIVLAVPVINDPAQDVLSHVAPSGGTPGTKLPLQLTAAQAVRATYAYHHNFAPTGRGQITFDWWLTRTPAQGHGFDVSQGGADIFMEVMVSVARWGNYGAHNGLAHNRNPQWYDHDAMLGGQVYHVYRTKNADGTWAQFANWRMVAFVTDGDLPASGVADIAMFNNHIISLGWASGNEYLMSVELGVEPVVGTGDVSLRLSVTP